MEPKLTARKVNDSPPGYRVWLDDGTGELEIGFISERQRHVGRLDVYWHWGVDIMPLMDHVGHTPSGEAESLEAAIRDFKIAFQHWLNSIEPRLWAENRDYKRAGAERWQR